MGLDYTRPWAHGEDSSFPPVRCHGIVNIRVSWSDLHFNWLHFVVGSICSLFINSTDICHKWCHLATSGTEDWSCWWGSPNGLWAGTHMLWEHRAWELGSRRKGFPRDMQAPQWMSREGRGAWKAGTPRQGSSPGVRKNLAPERYQKARRRQDNPREVSRG